ncbi:hypothetical protein ACOQFL_21905 [Actinopolyspora sp. H202]|uniref:hypothetical protein n=1 Tax=Actinopolyspora sp. H202 TaxID=1500456 RepID=UPI003EE4C691
MCYASQAKDIRANMAGTPDATQLPSPTSQGASSLEIAASKFRSIIQTVNSALGKAEEAHEGRAAEIAKASVAAVKPVVDNAAGFCETVQKSLDDQAGTQRKTFQDLPAEGGKLSDGRPAQMEPPEKNWADDSGVSDLPLMGWTSDYEEKQERYRATNAEANSVMGRYTEQTTAATQGLPEFKPPEDSNTDASRQAGYGGSAGGAMAGSTFDNSVGSGGSGYSAPAASSSAWTAGSGGSVGTGAAGGGSYAPAGGSGVAGGSSISQPAGSGSAWVNPSGGGSAGSGSLPPGAVRGSDGTVYRQGPDGGWQRQNPYNGRWAPAPNGPPGVSGGSGSGARGGAGGLGGGRAGGAGGLGGARGGYAGGTGAGEPAAGGRSGTGSYGPRGGGSTVSGANGANAAAGGRGAPMGGVGARQGDGGDEEEHDRPSWLVEDEDVFTNDMQRVAPPVLGETPYEQGR